MVTFFDSMVQRMLIASALALLATLWGCSSTQPIVQIEQHLEAHQDEAYSEQLDHSSRSAKVYIDFETKFIIYTTFLSPDFQSQMGRRLKELFSQKAIDFQPTSAEHAFLVSVFSPDEDVSRLNNTDLWTILMKGDAFERAPKSIRELEDKHRWTPLFPYIHKWSREYLLVFEGSSETPTDDAALIEPDRLSLVFSNADARVSMTW